MADNVVTKVVLQGEDRTGGMFSSFRNSIAGAEAASDGLKEAIGALGVTISAVGLIEMVKGSIEAADHLNDLSKTTGIAVEQLVGLRLAAKQSGGDLDGIAASVSKLSVNMGKDAEKFKLLGVSAKDPLEAFKQLSDVFVNIQDPQQRAAVAAAALGKSWMSAAPLLAEGGKRIGEMVDNGERLSKMNKDMGVNADEFNDKIAELKTTLGATTTKLVSDMLPAMNDITKAMQEAAKEGGLLKTVWVGLGGVMANLLGMTEADQTKKRIKDITDQLVIAHKQLAAGTLNPEGAGSHFFSFLVPDIKLGEDGLAKIRATVDSLEKEKARLSAGPTVVDPKIAADAANAAAKAAADAKARAEQFLKDAENAKAAQASYESFMKSVREKIALEQAEAAAGQKLTEAQKFQIDLESKLGEVIKSATPAQVAKAKSAVDEAVALKAANEERQKYDQLETGMLNRAADALEAQQKKTQAEIDGTQSMRDSTAEMLLSGDALLALKQARVDDEIAIQKRRLVIAASIDVEGDDAKAIRGTIAALEDRKKALAENNDAQKALKAQQQQIDMWKTIDSTAQQTFVSIFDSGKSAFDRLRDTLKNGLYALLYEMTMKKWIVSIGTSLGIPGASAYAQSVGGGTSGALNTASNVNSLFGGNSMSGLASGAYNWATGGAATGAGIYGMTGAATGMTELTSSVMGLAPAVEAGASAGISSALAAIPGWGWALGGAALLGSGALGGLFGGDGAAQRTGNWSGGLGQATTSTDNHWFSGKDMGQTMQEFSDSLKTSENTLITNLGLSATQIAAINTNLAALSGKQYGFGMEGTDWTQSGAEAQIAADRTQAIASALGLTTQQLADQMSVSLDSLKSAYNDAVMTDTEKLAAKTEAVRQQFAALGQSMPATIDDYKHLVESTAAAGDGSASLYRSLLELAPAFKEVASSASAATGTLQSSLAGLQSSWTALGSSGSLLNSVSGDTAPLSTLLGNLQSGYQYLTSATDQSTVLGQIVDAENKLNSARASGQADQAAALQTQLDNAKAMLDAAKGIKSYLSSIKLGDLSTLSPEQKLHEAESQYTILLAQAKSGDSTAAGQLQGVADSYLNAAKGYYASGPEYSRIFDSVTSSLDSFATTAISSNETLVSTLETSLQAQLSVSTGTYDSVRSLYQSSLSAYQQQMADATRQVIATDSVKSAISQLPPEIAGQLSASIASSLGPMISSLAASTGAHVSQAGIDTVTKSAATGNTAIAQDATALRVESVYENVLGRTADQGGLAYWTQQYESGALNDSNIVQTMINSAQGVDINAGADYLKKTGGAVPSFDVGSAYIPHDMTANIHAGEMVIDPQTSNYLRKYGISVNASGTAPEKSDSKETVAAINRLTRAVEAGNRSNEDRLAALERKLAAIETENRLQGAAA